jgi:DNA-binding NarL/FixJ family response regulator
MGNTMISLQNATPQPFRAPTNIRVGDVSAVQSFSFSVTRPVRVLLLEDSEADAELIRHELLRSGLAAVIKRVETEHDFALAIKDFLPDVVLSDHSLGTFDAQSALALLRSLRPTTPLILVTGSVDSEATVACIRAGAEDLITKVNLTRLAGSITKAVQLRRPLDKLTPRQIEVLRMVAEGHRTREIAVRLKLSVKTVESHRGEIMKRLAIHDVVGLVRYAMRVGLVSPAM